MEAGQIRLPRHAKGLKLIRIGVLAMLAQLALVLTSIMCLLFGHELRIDGWGQLLLLVNLAAACMMLAGSLFALPDFRRVRLPTSRVYVAAAGFALTLVALAWTYRVTSAVERILADPDVSLQSILHAQNELKSLKAVVLVKDIGYGAGLIAVLRIVRQFAVANDRLYLRDAASSLTGLFVLMLIGDMFYQLTYGMAGSVLPGLTLYGSLLISCFWLYCHLRMVRLLENAAYLADEPHHLPAATLVRAPAKVESPPQPSPRSPSSPMAATPSSVPVGASVVVPAAELRSIAPPVTAPRAEHADGEAPAEPKLLR